MTKAAIFAQSSVERLVKAAVKAGLSVQAIKVSADGVIEVITAVEDEAAVEEVKAPAASEFDELAEKWRAKRAKRVQGASSTPKGKSRAA